ncbi:hypothetical protein EJB05_03130, partial [Eragrostis curvula]
MPMLSPIDEQKLCGALPSMLVLSAVNDILDPEGETSALVADGALEYVDNPRRAKIGRRMAVDVGSFLEASSFMKVFSSS